MEYLRKNNTIYLRLNRGEEIISSLESLSKKENIKTAKVSGIGATNDVTVGVLITKTKEYKKQTFKIDSEITSLLGTITVKDSLPYIHLHCSLAGLNGTFGGHLNRATVSATAEIVIDIFDEEINRVFDENTGLNLFKFPYSTIS